MKCWCFNQEQLDAALAAFLAKNNMPTLAGEVIREFLVSPEAREHKLTLEGIWDRQTPAPSTPSTGERAP